jgi:predicted PurR-regulated permease PerM
MEKKVEITLKSIILFFATLLAILLIYYTRDIIVILFLALIIVATLSPIADWLTKYLKWRTLSVLIIYIVGLGLLSALFALIIPVLSSQTKSFLENLPNFTSQISWLEGYGQQVINDIIDSASIANITEYLAQSTTQVFQITGSVFGIIGSIFVVIAISFYGLVSENIIKKGIKNHLTKNKLEKYWEVSNKIYNNLGVWLRAQIVLGIIVGLITGFALHFLSIPYALLLGVLAGLLEIIPVLGPVLAAIPAIIIGISISPLLGLVILILFIVIQQTEAYILVPKVMEKALGLNPIVILTALLVGGKLGGIIGAIIAVPIASIVTTLIIELPKINEDTSQK